MSNPEKLDRNNVEDILALTPMQKGMLLHYLMEPESEQYFEQACYNLTGRIHPEKIKNAWEYVVKTNEILRTVLRWQGLAEPVQVVLKNHQVPFFEHDFSGCNCEERLDMVDRVMKNDRNVRVDISRQPFRIILCKLSENEYQMILSNHHIILDGWSNGIILKEFVAAYESLYTGNEPYISAKNRYREYVKWLQKQDRDIQKQFWSNYLKGFSDWKPFKAAVEKQSKAYGISRYEQELSRELVECITVFIREKGLTLATLFYCAWGILLHKYKGIHDVLFGTTVSGRPVDIKGIQDMVGIFINTVPLRMGIDPSEEVYKLLNKINSELATREDFENTPLVDVLSYSGLRNKDSLFDTVVVIQNYPMDERLFQSDRPINISLHKRFYVTRIELALGVRVFDRVILDFTYNTCLFNEESIRKMSEHFVKILEAMIGGTRGNSILIKDIQVVDEEEKKQMLLRIKQNNEDLKLIEEVDFDEIF